MAITIQSSPAAYTSVHGDALFVVCDIVKASDPVTYPDYRYICDVYVGATLVTRLKSYPHPDNKMGVFNVGNILRNYVAANFNPTALALRAQEMGLNEFYITATMKFGEEYNYVTYTNVTVDTARNYFNHYDGRKLGVNSNLANYANKVLTTRVLNTIVDLPTASSLGYPVDENNVNNYVPFLPDATGAITLRITSFTKSGTQINTQDHSTSPTAANTLQSYNLSPTAINTAYPGLIPLTVASYYTVQFLSPHIAVDKVIKFDLTCENKHEVYTIHFLNKLGGFESRNFNKVSRKVIDVERSEFGKLGFTLDSSGVVSYKNSNNVYNDTRTVFSTSYKEKLTLNTDVLTDVEYTWLGDLILSPMVYLEMLDETDNIYFVPCVIENNNYEPKKRINDQLTNLTINVEFGEVYNSQFR